MTHGVTINGEHASLYEKCLHCHLFIWWEDDGTTVHEDGTETAGCWIHSNRDDEPDVALDESHNPEPSGLIATLNTWQQFGPVAMKTRFLPAEFDSVHHETPDYIGCLLLGGVAWDDIPRSLMGVS